jgi:predicted MFS family arabinose efflux permease
MRRLRFEIGFFIAVRTVLNTGYRMIYPFLPVFARSLGVDIRTMSLALTVRATAGALGPLLAPFSDRKGRRFGMLLGIGLFASGAAVPLLGSRFFLFTAALVLMTIGKYAFDPSMQALLGDRIPYARRGTVLALTELGWALAFILGVPAAGFLITRFGWRAPFLGLACLGFAALAVVRAAFPGVQHPGPSSRKVENGRSPRSERPGHFRSFRTVFTSAASLAGLAVMAMVSAANESVNVVFGVWLEDSFGLKIAALAAASAVIGISEFGGESLVAVSVDRVGKFRAVLVGLAGNSAAALLLPMTGRSSFTAVAGLFAFYLTFEYTIVSFIPLMSEVLPEARATLLAFNTAAFSLGRAGGAWFSPRLYELGFFAVALGAVGCNAVALAALLRLRRLKRESDPLLVRS